MMARKLAVITGASKGIGAAAAEAFGSAKYDVVVNYLQDRDAAEKSEHSYDTDLDKIAFATYCHYPR